jgi:hypothetical protein
VPVTGSPHRSHRQSWASYDTTRSSRRAIAVCVWRVAAHAPWAHGGESSPWVTKGWMEADDKRRARPLGEVDPQEGVVPFREDRTWSDVARFPCAAQPHGHGRSQSSSASPGIRS